jgi:hypothetical protein
MMKSDMDRKQPDAHDTTVETVDENCDPLSGAPGAHPLGTGVGAAGGGVAGATVGSVGGPVGAAVGMVAGAVAGGLAGKSVAEHVDPTDEDAFWRYEYPNRKYNKEGEPYESYQPAYRIGYEGVKRYPGRTFEQAEMDLQRDYDSSQSSSGLSWEHAKQAAQDAWNRVKDSVSSDDYPRSSR